MSTGDLEALLRVTAPGYQGESPPDIAFDTTDTPVGRLVMAVTSRGVVACSFEDEHTIFARISREVGRFIGPDPSRVDPLRRELDAYFAGRLKTFSFPVDPRLTSQFGRAVLQALATVPYGSVATYEEIAARIGRPQALRAVSNAFASNPVCIVVPCHRVIETGGGLGGYAGGAAAKEHLLRLEGGYPIR
ncbi:methylated-DNA--[protein]-cysteine S-methyltransferase [Rhizohabitans arisaemae]|uniref:methylated-DNA--[protein]-cysteine S-methyltransferase n=1 Tax=Rhizohabitans arisaemae TaxID=2720610 RepID=UPI0024B1FAF9|nr:methylated-DNA--[protein]-cysteine S-methyltransferase [Rhizohabitans arisaemae]